MDSISKMEHMFSHITEVIRMDIRIIIILLIPAIIIVHLFRIQIVIKITIEAMVIIIITTQIKPDMELHQVQI